MNKVKIMEVTLRDGSYAINYSFTASDTALICEKLEHVGFELIEVGHGVGFRGSEKGYGRAMESDEAYMKAAEGALKKAKYGMFCIPGIAELPDLDTAAKHNMSFVRVGTNITEVRNSEPFIKKAKDNGMFVCANYMKSYALPPEKFAENVLLSEKYGADMVYIVDSSGGMFPEDVEAYYNAIRKVSDIDIGFHGHDNLGMAICNSIKAAKLGATIIDASMQGLGRSAGNAATEILVAALLKKKYKLGIHLLELLDVGQEYVQPLLTAKGRMQLDTVAGYADFHSSYMHKIEKFSEKYKVNPALLIIELCKVDKVNASDETLDKVAKSIKSETEPYLAKYGFERYIGGEQDERK